MVHQAHSQYWLGNLDQSAATLATASKRATLDRDVLQLDQAMIDFHRNEFRKSKDNLRAVRDRLESSPLGAGAVNSLSYLSDESKRVYIAEDHEKILLQVMLAFNSLLSNDGDATAYAHQIGDQCEALLNNRPVVEVPPTTAGAPITLSVGPPSATITPAVPTPPTVIAAQAIKVDPIRRELAIAPLMRSLVRGQSRMNHDDLVRHLEQAHQWRPDSQFISAELHRAVNNEQPPAGFGTLYVIALVGKGPRKIETTEPVSSQAMLIADQLLSAMGRYTLPPTLAPIKIAKIELSPVTIDNLNIVIDDQTVGHTEVIADIGRLAVERQTELMPQIIARGVVRRIVKKGVVVAGKKASGVEANNKGDLTSLGYDIAGVVWEATEKADLRSWSLLPGSLQIIRVDLPAGKHRLSATPARLGRQVGGTFVGNADVFDGRTTFAIASITDAKSVGQIIQ